MKSASPFKNPYVHGLSPSQCKQHYRRLQIATTTAAQQSLLLSLPPELRNRIYELVLIDEEFIPLRQDSEDTKAVTRAGQRVRKPLVETTIEEPPLLQSCRQIRNEAIQIYYARNTFVCESTTRLVHWLGKLGNHGQKMLRDVRMKIVTYSRGLSGDFKQGLLALKLKVIEKRIRRSTIVMALPDNAIRGWRCDKSPATALTVSEIKAAFTEEQRWIYKDIKREDKANKVRRKEAKKARLEARQPRRAGR